MTLSQVSLPRFAQLCFQDRVRCPRCEMKITEQDIRFAGAGRANDGSVCFSYQYECPACRKMYSVTDRIRRFSRPDWWHDLVQWQDEDRSEERLMPNVGPMVLDSIGLESIWIRGGYKGDVGPVMLIYSMAKSHFVEGCLRLERNSAVSLFDHEAPNGLPVSKLEQFAAAAEGSIFELGGRQWQKMSAKEIREIIRDHVFTVKMDAEPVTTPVVKKRRRHDSLHPKKSSKGTRRPPRNPRSVD